MKSLLGRPDLRMAEVHFSVAACASRAHDILVTQYIERYGDGNGHFISGVVRDHFPEDRKAVLQDLCALINEHNDKGRAARPKGVRMETMHRLAREVCKRDGTGFYGYVKCDLTPVRVTPT